MIAHGCARAEAVASASATIESPRPGNASSISENVMAVPVPARDDDLEADDLSVSVDLDAMPTTFGRGSEAQVIRDAFDSILPHADGDEGAKPKTMKTILLHGESGCGKTALVDSVRDYVLQRGGYLCTGKFFQSSGTAREAYSAITAAFSDYCDLITQSPGFEEERLPAIQKALGGADGQLLSRSIAGLSNILPQTWNDAHNKVDIQDGVAFTKFKVACTTFIRAMATRDTPMVLALDDIQWMDEGSRGLLKYLLQDHVELNHLLLILLYRDEEADAVQEIIDTGRGTHIDISLRNLDKDAVRDMVSFFLMVKSSSHSMEFVSDLTDLVFQRTHGNPFFVGQFLDLVNHEMEHTECNLIDVEELRQNTSLPSTLADTILHKTQRLSLNVRKVIHVASLLGYNFDELVLTKMVTSLMDASVLTLPISRTASCVDGGDGGDDYGGDNNSLTVDSNIATLVADALSHGVCEKVIERTATHGIFQFSHDMLQASFSEMTDHGMDRAQTHQVMGTVFLEQCKEEDPSASYYAAVHLNQAKTLNNDNRKDVSMARINLEASKICQSKSAFNQAAELLMHALSFLDQDTMWSNDETYHRTQEIHQLIARMAFALGDFEAANHHIRNALDKAKNRVERLGPIMIRNDIQLAMSSPDKFVQLVKRSLEDIEFKLPKLITPVTLLLKLRRVRRMMHGKTDECILNLPRERDPVYNAHIKLGSQFSMLSLVEGHLFEGIYMALELMEMTVEKGLSDWCLTVIATYAILELNIGHMDSAVRFAELALTLREEFSAHTSQGIAFITQAAFILHWKFPLKDMVKVIDRSVAALLDSGDKGQPMVETIIVRIAVGEPLGDVEEASRTLHSRLSDMRQYGTMKLLAIPYQFVLNLQSSFEDGDCGNPRILMGEVMNEEDFLLNDKEEMAQYMVHFFVHKLQLAFHFEDLDGARLLLIQTQKYMKQVFRYHYYCLMVDLIGGLTYFDLNRRSKKSSHIRQARKHLKSLRKSNWMQLPGSGNNVEPYLELLVAEECASGTRKSRTDMMKMIGKYDAAIACAREANFPHLEALANERASIALCRDNYGYISDDNYDQAQLARSYLHKSMALYGSVWGATAKYEWLERRSHRLLSDGEQQSMAFGPSHLVGQTIVISDTNIEGISHITNPSLT